MSVGSPINYTTLIGSSSTDGSIAQWLNHAAIQGSADNIVYEAESAIYRSLRHWRMLTSVTGILTANTQDVTQVNTLALPTDYLEDKVLYTTGQNYQKLTRKPMEEIIASWAYSSNNYLIVQQPIWYFNDKNNFVFDSPSDQAYPYLLYYYQQPASLFTSGTNFITQFYPRLLRAACCAAAAEFMKDVGQGSYDRTYWVQQFEASLMQAQTESDHSVRSQKIGMMLE